MKALDASLFSPENFKLLLATMKFAIFNHNGACLFMVFVQVAVLGGLGGVMFCSFSLQLGSRILLGQWKGPS